MKIFLLPVLLAVVFFTSTFCVSAQDSKTYSYAKLSSETATLSDVKADLTDIFKSATSLMSVIDLKANAGFSPKQVLVLDDRIQVLDKNRSYDLYYSELIGYPIILNGETKTGYNPYPFSPIVRTRYTYIARVQSLVDFVFSDQLPAVRLAENLYSMHHLKSVERFDSLLTVFKPIAAQYRALQEKPPMPEEQRKYFVQANALTEQKQYEKSIELFIKAIQINNTTFPGAYSNLSLLYAQIHYMDIAIFYMKKYLLLEPEAPDARSMQDKIYEWELQMQK